MVLCPRQKRSTVDDTVVADPSGVDHHSVHANGRVSDNLRELTTQPPDS
jgi:hypothetical protein